MGSTEPYDYSSGAMGRNVQESSYPYIIIPDSDVYVLDLEERKKYGSYRRGVNRMKCPRRENPKAEDTDG